MPEDRKTDTFPSAPLLPIQPPANPERKENLKNIGETIHPVLSLFRTAGWLPLLLFILTPVAGDTGDWHFADGGDFSAWRGEGIDAGGPVPGGIQVRGGEQFRLFSPPNLGIPAAEKPYLRIRFRPQSPRYLRVFWLDGAGRPVLVPEAVQPPFDRHFHTFWIPLAKGAKHRGTLETLGLIFGGHPGWVEIDSIEIRPFSFGGYLSDQLGELFLPRNLHPGTINSLHSPRIFNQSLIGWLNQAALLIILAGAILYFKSRGINSPRLAGRVGLALLILWLAYDLQETYSHLRTAEEIYRDYVKPPPEEKTFPALGDFYRFVSFCRENLPPAGPYEIIPRGYWPYDCRLNYFLYPRHYMWKRSQDYYAGRTLYYLVYNQPFYRFSAEKGRVVTAEGQPVTGSGRLVARYNPASFIFRED